jgi:hypothetical protein
VGARVYSVQTVAHACALVIYAAGAIGPELSPLLKRIVVGLARSAELRPDQDPDSLRASIAAHYLAHPPDPALLAGLKAAIASTSGAFQVSSLEEALQRVFSPGELNEIAG